MSDILTELRTKVPEVVNALYQAAAKQYGVRYKPFHKPELESLGGVLPKESLQALMAEQLGEKIPNGLGTLIFRTKVHDFDAYVRVFRMPSETPDNNEYSVALIATNYPTFVRPGVVARDKLTLDEAMKVTLQALEGKGLSLPEENPLTAGWEKELGN